MNEDNKFWLIFWAIVASTICCVTIAVAAYNAYQTKCFIEAGMVKKLVPGRYDSQWVKDDSK